MRTDSLGRSAPVGALAIAAAMTLAACTSAPMPDGPSPQPSPPTPLLLSTVRPSTVIDNGENVQLCLGGVFQPSVPACMSGLILVGWDWSGLAGTYEQSGDARWGDYIVTGEYDQMASELVVTETGVADAVVEYTAEEFEAVQQEILREFDILSIGVDPDANVLHVDVVFDHDHALQRELDAEYGRGSTIVRSVLEMISP